MVSEVTIVHCEHLSGSGVDQTPLDNPAKVWRCDACGWRYRVVPDPEHPGCSKLVVA